MRTGRSFPRRWPAALLGRCGVFCALTPQREQRNRDNTTSTVASTVVRYPAQGRSLPFRSRVPAIALTS